MPRRNQLCITYQMLHRGATIGMTSCPGSELLERSHCMLCDFWEGNMFPEFSRESCVIRAEYQSGELPFDEFCMGVTEEKEACFSCEYYMDGFQGGLK